MFYQKFLFDDVDSIFNDVPTTLGRTPFSSRLSSHIQYKSENDKLEIAVSVLGHDPKNVEVELTPDKIFVKALRDKDDKTIKSAFVSDVHETLKLHHDYDGLSAKAKIENGILHIIVEKKEESKPKKLSIKF